MKKNITMLTIAMVAGAAGAALVSHDANIAIDNLGALLKNEGTLVQAGNYNDNAVAVTVGGIAFAPETAAAGWAAATDYGGTDENINLLVNTQVAKNWGEATATTITGLTVGQEYRVQVLAGERWGWQDTKVNLLGTAPGTGNWINTVDGVKGIDLVTYEFVAAGDTLDIAYASTGTENGQLAGYAVHAIPEPATIGLVSMVGAGLLFIRRKFDDV
ncbi:MAG: PEP-CTERM sorting domain-containing protein [Verrucomicrobiota bacterium]